MERKVTGTILVLVSIIGCHRNDMSEIPQGLRADAEKYYEKYTAGEFMDEDFQIEVWSHKLPVTIVARDHNYYGFAKRHPGFANMDCLIWKISNLRPAQRRFVIHHH